MQKKNTNPAVSGGISEARAKASRILSRYSDYYCAYQSDWMKAIHAYRGGRFYIGEALIRHISECELEYKERKNRAVYINLPLKIANMIVEFLFNSEPDRGENSSTNEEIEKDFTREGTTVTDFMRQVELYQILFGDLWVLVDYPTVSGALTLADKQTARIRPYAKLYSPLDVPDFAIGPDGAPLWVIVEDRFESKDDPYRDKVDVRRRRLWTRDRWELYEERSNGEKAMIASGEHNLGRVPVVRYLSKTGGSLGLSHWFNDVVRAGDAILNALSESQMNTIKQMFGLLVVSETFAANGGALTLPETGTEEEQREIEQQLREYRFALARSSALWETQDEKGLSRYISPEGANTENILKWIEFLRAEISDVLRIALTSTSKDAQTAESKEWDNLKMQQSLSARSHQLEDVERDIWNTMALWDKSIAVPEISYNDTFRIQDLKTMTECLMDITSFSDTGDEFRRATLDTALVILDRMNRLPAEQYKKIEHEIRTAKFQKTELPEMPGVDEIMKSIGAGKKATPETNTKAKEGASRE